MYTNLFTVDVSILAFPTTNFCAQQGLTDCRDAYFATNSASDETSAASKLIKSNGYLQTIGSSFFSFGARPALYE